MAPRKLRSVEEKEGNPSKEAPRKDPIKLPARLPEEPDWHEYFPVTKGPEAKVNARCRAEASYFFRLYIAEMGPTGVVALLDEILLRRAAVNYARIDQCERAISIEGYSADGERGSVKHPAITIVNLCDARLISQMRELGMTPLQREKLSPKGGQDDEDDTDFHPSAHPRVGDTTA